jgi:hypothetical protein
MTKKTKALIFNMVGFAILFIIFRYALQNFTNLNGIWLPLTSFVISTILAPKFQAIKQNNVESIYMSWIFLKGVKKID